MALLLFCGASGVMEASPNSIRFQGRITDNQGNPIVGPEVRVRFSFFDASYGGAKLWETGDRTVSTNESGLFSADLGPLDAALFSSNPDMFLEIAVHDGSDYKVLKPRQKLSSVPFAFYSDNAQSANRADQSNLAENIADNTVSTSKIQNGAVTADKIAGHSISTAAITPGFSAMLIPSGMVALFAQSCPAGWTRFDLLDNRFPLGVPSFSGNPGGSNQITGLTTAAAGGHSHTVNAHKHDAGTLIAAASSQFMGDEQDGGGVDNWPTHTHPITGNTGSSSPGTNTQGLHTHAISSDGHWLPPFLGMVFCQKD